MGLTKTASSAVNLLMHIGYFPVHVNLDILKFNIPTDHSKEMVATAGTLLADSSDPDEVSFSALLHASLANIIWVIIISLH